MLSHLQKDRDSRRMTRASQLLLGLILALLSLSALVRGSLGEFPYLFILFLAAVVVSPTTLRFPNKRQLERIARSGTSNATFGFHRIRLTSEGMLDRPPGTRCSPAGRHRAGRPVPPRLHRLSGPAGVRPDSRRTAASWKAESMSRAPAPTSADPRSYPPMARHPTGTPSRRPEPRFR